MEVGEIKNELAKQIKLFPKLPGVYLMKDADGKIIYVGKARDLRARVSTYFKGGDGRAQIEFLMHRVQTVDKIITDSEQQAFVLERDLIARHKPRYNIRLKDDKAYFSIRIDKNENWPRLKLVRRVENDGARYYGPYSFSYELKNLLEIVKRVVPLRTCTDTVFYNRQRPCLEYEIKRCCGPCCLPVNKEQYQAWVKQAMSILEGRVEPLVKEMTKEMEALSEDFRYEEAAVVRDRIKTLESARVGQGLVSSSGDERDVFALYREESFAVVTVMRVRHGRVADTENFSFMQVSIPDEEVIQAAVGQFYEGHEIPPEILVPAYFEGQDILLENLKKTRASSVVILVPERGVKFRLLKLAKLNAQQHFFALFEREARQVRVAEGMAQLFRLKQVPRNIECVDISNLQGSDIVGALVSFYDGEPDKERYRKYLISCQDKPDDFGAVLEVVIRRLKRGIQEEDLPDLLVIDGGPGQLAKALEARESCGIKLDIVALAKERAAKRSMAKKPERVFLEGVGEPVVLVDDSPLTHFLQRVRDEAHRFVISFHRQKRNKRVLGSELDGVRGLGLEEKRRLLEAFGSVSKMKGVSPEKIAEKSGLSVQLARAVSRLLSP